MVVRRQRLIQPRKRGIWSGGDDVDVAHRRSMRRGGTVRVGQADRGALHRAGVAALLVRLVPLIDDQRELGLRRALLLAFADVLTNLVVHVAEDAEFMEPGRHSGDRQRGLPHGQVVLGRVHRQVTIVNTVAAFARNDETTYAVWSAVIANCTVPSATTLWSIPDSGGGGPVIRCGLNVTDVAAEADVETVKVVKQAIMAQIAMSIIRLM
jgi:hypothetical protein